MNKSKGFSKMWFLVLLLVAFVVRESKGAQPRRAHAHEAVAAHPHTGLGRSNSFRFGARGSEGQEEKHDQQAQGAAHRRTT